MQLLSLALVSQSTSTERADVYERPGSTNASNAYERQGLLAEWLLLALPRPFALFCAPLCAGLAHPGLACCTAMIALHRDDRVLFRCGPCSKGRWQ